MLLYFDCELFLHATLYVYTAPRPAPPPTRAQIFIMIMLVVKYNVSVLRQQTTHCTKSNDNK